MTRISWLLLVVVIAMGILGTMAELEINRLYNEARMYYKEVRLQYQIITDLAERLKEAEIILDTYQDIYEGKISIEIVPKEERIQ